MVVYSCSIFLILPTCMRNIGIRRHATVPATISTMTAYLLSEPSRTWCFPDLVAGGTQSALRRAMASLVKSEGPDIKASNRYIRFLNCGATWRDKMSPDRINLAPSSELQLETTYTGWLACKISFKRLTSCLTVHAKLKSPIHFNRNRWRNLKRRLGRTLLTS